LFDGVAHERGRIGRQLARCELRDRRARFGHSVDAERTPVVAVEVECQQVPPARENDEAVGLDVSLRGRAVACGVREPEPYAVVARAGDYIEDFARDRVGGAEPRREHRGRA